MDFFNFQKFFFLARPSPQPRLRRKAILSMDSISNMPSGSSELRPRSYTDIHQQPSTSSGLSVNFSSQVDQKGNLRRGRPPNQPPKMLPFLLKSSQIVGGATTTTF